VRFSLNSTTVREQLLQKANRIFEATQLGCALGQLMTGGKDMRMVWPKNNLPVDEVTG